MSYAGFRRSRVVLVGERSVMYVYGLGGMWQNVVGGAVGRLVLPTAILLFALRNRCTLHNPEIEAVALSVVVAESIEQ